MNNDNKRLGGQIDTRRWYSRYDKIEILKKTKGRCAACGKKIKVEPLNKDYEKKQYKNIELMTMDHIIPIDRGGWDVASNMLPLCYDCNQKKGNMLYVPSYFYTAMNGHPLMKQIDADFAKWFIQDIKPKFRIEQYPLIAPRSNVCLSPEIEGYIGHKTKPKTQIQIPGSILTWEHMGETNKEEVLKTTKISLKEVKTICAITLNKKCYVENFSKRRLLSVYSCKKKNTGKILAIAGICYDKEEKTAAIYIPYVDAASKYASHIVWSFVLTLNNVLTQCEYGLEDIILIMPESQEKMLQEINHHCVNYLAYIKGKTLHGYMDEFQLNEYEPCLLLYISEHIVHGDDTDYFRKQFRKKKEEKQNIE